MKKNNQPDRIQEIMLGGIFLWLAIWGSKMIAAGNFLVGIILSLVGLTQCYPRLARGLKGLNFKKATSVFSIAQDKNPQGILDQDTRRDTVTLYW